ncbi:FGGY-family carbohydrate kinase [Pseudonocardia spinosispora]|uniref:FGGY-family carbohydrate kinase n=1 Tax=Pseudonocardia spinosispora TaxID=103441 RepID=UPI0003FD9320|nr:FGGY family carbohydrate kinase [Pseudonocardia spinosispora]
MAHPLLVGLDVGTTATKAVVLTPDGAEVAYGRAPTPWTTTSTGAQLDARELAAAVDEAVGEALAAAPTGWVVGTGVASMAESGILLDRAGEPVGPVVAWHDRRDHREVDELRDEIGTERFSATTGLPFRGQWSLTKQRWLGRHLPEIGSAVRRLGVAEWIVHHLGGEQASEQSLASRTGWLRLADRTWWPETLEWSGIASSLLPPLRAPGVSWGKVRPGHAAGGAVLTVAGHDHQAAAVGVGATGIGAELDSCGSAEALVRTVTPGLSEDALRALTEGGVTVGWHVLADRWCLLGATEGGLTLAKVLRSLGVEESDLAALDEQALAEEPTGPAQIWRYALQEVTEEAGGLHRLMSRLTGPASSLIMTGGWARSAGLREVKKQVLGDVSRSPVTEAGARGAALLAGLAGGLYANQSEFPQLSEEPR